MGKLNQTALVLSANHVYCAIFMLQLPMFGPSKFCTAHILQYFQVPHYCIILRKHVVVIVKPDGGTRGVITVEAV
jgi:hypothetical protein